MKRGKKYKEIAGILSNAYSEFVRCAFQAGVKNEISLVWVRLSVLKWEY